MDSPQRLVGTEEPQATFTYGNDDVAEIRYGMAGALELRGPGATGEAPARRPLPATYPDVTSTALPAPAPAAGETRERLGSMEQRAVLRREFSASELLAYSVCPMLHLQGYRGGMSTPVIEVTDMARVVSDVLPEKRGDILHDYFRAHSAEWDDARMLAEMTKAVLRHLPMPEADAETNARDLLAPARRYLESEWYARVENALEVHREVPFVAQLDDGSRIVGEIDILFREADGWRIIDFKTGRFGETANAESAQLAAAKRAAKYRIQAAAYSVAVREALGKDQMKEFVFFFTDPGLSASVSVDETWLAAQRETLCDIVGRIRAGDYGNGAERTCDERCECRLARQTVSAAA